MRDNTNNKEFWNNYVTYWESKVEEANKDAVAKDKTVDDKLLEVFFDKLNVQPNEKVLDYGCGSCRLYPILSLEYFFCASSKVTLDTSTP